MINKIYGLVGRSLKHSYSPFIHSQMGCKNYGLIELEPDNLPAFFKNPNIAGLNVTIPYKKDVMAFCDNIDNDAKLVGSINTIVRAKDNKLYGYNTDVYGLSYAAKRANIIIKNKKVLILGSGGASLAAQAVAKNEGANFVVVSRTGENNYNNLHINYDAQVIINATPVGMYPNNMESPVNLNMFKACEGVIDMVYNPSYTKFLFDAKALGIRHTNGLPMLVAQAAAAEELFFGKKIDDELVESIIKSLEMDATNIVLIGMPGSGKSTIGSELAKISGKKLVDIDAEIVKTAGMEIPQIFAQKGEKAFRAMEKEHIEQFGKEHGQIIVTGGGAVKDESNYYPLKQNAKIFFINRDISLLEVEGRPLSQGAKLIDMYRDRIGFYNAFKDFEVDNDRPVEQVAMGIWHKFLEEN